MHSFVDGYDLLVFTFYTVNEASSDRDDFLAIRTAIHFNVRTDAIQMVFKSVRFEYTSAIFQHDVSELTDDWNEISRT